MCRFRNFHLIPDPLNSLEQYYRFHHLDIPQLDDDEIIDEFYALRPLLWRLPVDHWLRARLRMLVAEITKRKVNISQESRAQPKLKLAEGVILE